MFCVFCVCMVRVGTLRSRRVRGTKCEDESGRAESPERQGAEREAYSTEEREGCHARTPSASASRP